MSKSHEQGKDDPSQAYGEYLVLLQERNRLLKKLRAKDSKQQELERREQGFSLYLNGANVDLRLNSSPSKRSSRKSKTAGDHGVRRLDSANDQDELLTLRETLTAPSKTTRKNWGASAGGGLKIKTEGGSKIEVNAPEKYSGNYSEDFELYESYLEAKLEEEEALSYQDDVEDPDKPQIHISAETEQPSSNSVQVSDNEEDHNLLTFTLNDVKALRESLENDEEIARSIKEASELAGRNAIEDESMSETKAKEMSFSVYDDDKEIGPAKKDFSIRDADEIAEEIEFANDTFEIDGGNVHVLGETHENGQNAQKWTSSTDDNFAVKQPAVQKMDTLYMDTGLQRSTVKANLDKSSDLVVDKSMEVRTFQSSSPKARPLSASRRKVAAFPVSGSSIQPEEIAHAMAQENKLLEPLQRQAKTSPTSNTSLKATSDSKRPSTVDSGTLTNETISLITEKVKKMNSSQQAKLLNMLSKIETLSSGVFDEDGGKDYSPRKDIKYDTPFSLNKQRKIEDHIETDEVKGGHKIEVQSKVVLNDTNIAKSNSSPVIDTPSSTDYNKNPAHERHLTEVVVEIISNWGHNNFTGLTELQFFDKNKKLIELTSNQVELTSDHVAVTNPANLINGKTRTVKEKCMWKCKNRADQNIELTFYVPLDSPNYNKSLSSIIIWNYNRSLKELSVGVKDIRIFIGGELIWTGIVDKGCGNKMFDYSKEIILGYKLGEACAKSEDQMFDQVFRCETRTIVRGSHDIDVLPVVDMGTPQPKVDNPKNCHESSTFIANTSLDVNKQSENSSYTCHVDSQRESLHACKDALGKCASLSRSKSISTPNLKSSDPMSAVNTKGSGGDNVDVKRSRSRGDEPSTPIWLTEAKQSSPRASSSASFHSDLADPFNITSERGPPSSGRRSSQGSRDRKRQSTAGSNRVINSGRRAGSARNIQTPEDIVRGDSSVSAKTEKLATVLDTGRKKNNTEPFASKGGSRSPDFSRSRKQLSSSESRTDQLDNIALEQSLKCIDRFEKDHRGRITKDVDLIEEGDVMDDLLKLPKREHWIGGEEQSMPMNDADLLAEDEIQHFEIPVLPSGKVLTINIKTTWGDRHYVGLNGIEIFEANGKVVSNIGISADPSDINILPEYDNDPRVINNILDGVYMTRDDMHLWLTPFTPGENHFISMTFDAPVTIAMIRIWNYNKSRIHSFRGVKDVEMTLDNNLIFAGEIARASGVLSKSAEPYGDIILFTMDENILEDVSQNDFLLRYSSEEEDQLMESVNFYRPRTADIGIAGPDRPLTCPKVRTDSAHHESFCVQSSEAKDALKGDLFYDGHQFVLNFVETWGDPYYLGLTGLEILNEHYESMPLSFEMMTATPKDLNDLPDFDDDDRTLDKLVDGVNVTMSDEHMWMIPFSEGEDHIVSINFGNKVTISGFRIWNYNKSQEDTYRGAKLVHVAVDGRVISPDEGYLLRKGPGQCHFDFAQDILFSEYVNPPRGITSPGTASSTGQSLDTELDTRNMPAGFVFQLRLFTSWGDPYYIGLNGIQLFNDKLQEIDLAPNNITAFPHSVNVLDETINDIRTPDKLVDGVNDTFDGRHMWLAPIIPGEINIIYVVFDQPVIISMIKLWNYSKTADRGVQQFGLYVDDLLVYNGVLPRVSSHSRGILPTIDMPVPHHTVLFTDDENVVSMEKKYVLMNSSNIVEQDIQLTNDRSVINPRFGVKPQGMTADPSRRPMTSITSQR